MQPESRPNGQMKTAIRQSQEGVRERGTEGNSFSKMRAGLSCDSYSPKDTPLYTTFYSTQVLLNFGHMYDGNSTCKIFTLHSHILLSYIYFFFLNINLKTGFGRHLSHLFASAQVYR